MAAPIRKVTPSGFITGPITGAVAKALETAQAADSPSIHASIGTLGVVLSSTVPGALHRSANARQQIRRIRGLH